MNPYRKDFPIFEGNDKIYFDNAATTQRPARVFAEMTAFNDTCNANPLRGLYAWSVEATRRPLSGQRRTVRSSSPETPLNPLIWWPTHGAWPTLGKGMRS